MAGSDDEPPLLASPPLVAEEEEEEDDEPLYCGSPPVPWDPASLPFSEAGLFCAGNVYYSVVVAVPPPFCSPAGVTAVSLFSCPFAAEEAAATVLVVEVAGDDDVVVAASCCFRVYVEVVAVVVAVAAGESC